MLHVPKTEFKKGLVPYSTHIIYPQKVMVQEVREEFQAFMQTCISLQCPKQHASLNFSAMSQKSSPLVSTMSKANPFHATNTFIYFN